MVGIVVVSHSEKLAEGVVELARTMGGADVRIQAAGGLSLPGHPLGTDPMLILSAIEGVYSDDGVLVLMDLGSAILSAEMAVEMLPDEKREKVILCEAPIVEGAIAASAQARIGNSLQQVAEEARQALSAKTKHLRNPVEEPDPVVPVKDDLPRTEAIETHVRVRNSLGLHARAAARLVEVAGSFVHTEIMVKNFTTGRGPANAKSMIGIMALEVLQGHELLISASGLEAQAALNKIQRLADDNFGDVD